MHLAGWHLDFRILFPPLVRTRNSKLGLQNQDSFRTELGSIVNHVLNKGGKLTVDFGVGTDWNKSAEVDHPQGDPVAGVGRRLAEVVPSSTSSHNVPAEDQVAAQQNN